jgi:hypothetical protein
MTNAPPSPRHGGAIDYRAQHSALASGRGRALATASSHRRRPAAWWYVTHAPLQPSIIAKIMSALLTQTKRLACWYSARSFWDAAKGFRTLVTLLRMTA